MKGSTAESIARSALIQIAKYPCGSTEFGEGPRAWVLDMMKIADRALDEIHWLREDQIAKAHRESGGSKS